MTSKGNIKSITLNTGYTPGQEDSNHFPECSGRVWRDLLLERLRSQLCLIFSADYQNVTADSGSIQAWQLTIDYWTDSNTELKWSLNFLQRVETELSRALKYCCHTVFTLFMLIQTLSLWWTHWDILSFSLFEYKCQMSTLIQYQRVNQWWSQWWVSWRLAEFHKSISKNFSKD